MDFIQVSAKTVDDALTEACVQLGTTSDKLEYEVIEKGSTGFLGIGSRNAVIKVRKVCSVEDIVKDFLDQVFKAMDMEVTDDYSVAVGTVLPTLHNLNIVHIAFNFPMHQFFDLFRTVAFIE